LAEICFVGLVIELFTSLYFGHITYFVGQVPVCHFATIEIAFAPFIALFIIGFDELSSYFFCLLAFALLICFFFLAEYFEYDANASAIITLSAAFSQAVMFYFCSFDLLSILIF
jgi:hypothetical protein